MWSRISFPLGCANGIAMFSHVEMNCFPAGLPIRSKWAGVNVPTSSCAHHVTSRKDLRYSMWCESQTTYVNLSPSCWSL